VYVSVHARVVLARFKQHSERVDVRSGELYCT